MIDNVMRELDICLQVYQASAAPDYRKIRRKAYTRLR
jgi:hypothetical protein